MKYLYSTLVFLLLFTAMKAQQIEIIQSGIDYHLRITEVVDNGTDYPDTTITSTYLGDTATLVQGLRNLDRSWSNEYVRLLSRLQALDHTRRDRDLTNAAAKVGVNLDSLNDARYSDDLLRDTFRLIVFTNRLSADELAQWTTEISPPNRLDFNLIAERRPNGIIRIASPLIAGGFNRVSMESPQYFRIRGLPRCEYFYLEGENDRVMQFRSVNVGPAVYRVIVRK